MIRIVEVYILYVSIPAGKAVSDEVDAVEVDDVLTGTSVGICISAQLKSQEWKELILDDEDDDDANGAVAAKLMGFGST
jgi:hypothetical protein